MPDLHPHDRWLEAPYYETMGWCEICLERTPHEELEEIEFGPYGHKHYACEACRAEYEDCPAADRPEE